MAFKQKGARILQRATFLDECVKIIIHKIAASVCGSLCVYIHVLLDATQRYLHEEDYVYHSLHKQHIQLLIEVDDGGAAGVCGW